MFEVRVFVNQQPVQILYFSELGSAVNSANDYEDKGYICEINNYVEYKVMSREFWRRRVEEK